MQLKLNQVGIGLTDTGKQAARLPPVITTTALVECFDLPNQGQIILLSAWESIPDGYHALKDLIVGSL